MALTLLSQLTKRSFTDLFKIFMKILPIYAGYINLKPINGVIFPSYAQNQINKDYIVNKLNGEFFMSTNENTYGRNNIVLRSLLE